MRPRYQILAAGILIAVLAATALLRFGIMAHPAQAHGSITGHAPISNSTSASSGACSTLPGWHVVPSPNPSTGENILDGVADISPTDVWAVGPENGPGAPGGLAEHWDGTQWSAVPTPQLQPEFGGLKAVAAVSSTDVWAVGFNAGDLIEHWNGTQWSIVSNGSTPGGYLSGVAAISSTDVWAVGNINFGATLIEHWDGTQWSVVPSPNPAPGGDVLDAVTAISANDIWAVGAIAADGHSTPLAEHWDGTSWSAVSTPTSTLNAGHNEFYGVSAVTSTDVWADGVQTDAGGIAHPLVEHWNGTAWAVSPSVSFNPNYLLCLNAIVAISKTDVVAVGEDDDLGGGTLVEQWDGSQWSVVGGSKNWGARLFAVTALSARDIWTVGDTFSSTSPNQALSLTVNYLWYLQHGTPGTSGSARFHPGLSVPAIPCK